jgi:hypothetical protein
MKPADDDAPKHGADPASVAASLEATREIAHRLNSALGSAMLIATTLEVRVADVAADLDRGTHTRAELEALFTYFAEGMRILTSSLASAGELTRSLQTIGSAGGGDSEARP